MTSHRTRLEHRRTRAVSHSGLGPRHWLGRTGRTSLAIAVTALVATACVPTAPPPGGPTGCGKPASPVALQPRKLLSGGVVRSFLLTIPDNYDPQVPSPLILNFHGHGSNAIQQALYTQLDARGKTRGFIVATPDGIANQFDFAAPSVDFTFTEELVRYLDSDRKSVV